MCYVVSEVIGLYKVDTIKVKVHDYDLVMLTLLGCRSNGGFDQA